MRKGWKAIRDSRQCHSSARIENAEKNDETSQILIKNKEASLCKMINKSPNASSARL